MYQTVHHKVYGPYTHTRTKETRDYRAVIRYPPQLQYKKLQTNTTHTKVYNIILIIFLILKEKGKKYIFIINNYSIIIL